jgi:hypothetical protein
VLQLLDVVIQEVIVPLFLSGHVKVMFESSWAGIGEQFTASWE